LKILQISPFMKEQFGGTERYCYNLSKYLAARVHEVHVYTSKLRASNPSVEYLDGFYVHRFYAPKVVWNINPTVLIIHKLIKPEFDIIHVHSHLYFSSIQAALAHKIMKKPPLILHLHGGLGLPPTYKLDTVKSIAKNFFDKTVARFTVNSADVVFSISQHDLNYAKKTFKLKNWKAMLVPNAVDLKEFNPEKKQGTVNDGELIYVGDLELWKGVHYLIKAFKKLYQRNNRLTLKIIGEGRSREKLERLASGLPVKFTGQLSPDKVSEHLAKASIFILPSLWEGMPTVALEAMACKVPVIATDVGGVSEIVKHKETGLLVPPKNPGAIADSVELLLNDGILKRRIIENAFKQVEQKYNFEKIAEIVEKIYQKILSKQK